MEKIKELYCIDCGKYKYHPDPETTEFPTCNKYTRKIYTSIFWQKPEWCEVGTKQEN